MIANVKYWPVNGCVPYTFLTQTRFKGDTGKNVFRLHKGGDKNDALSG